MQTITMYLRAASVKGTLVDEWNQAVPSPPALTRGLRAELVLKLVDANGEPLADEELDYAAWDFVVANDWDTTTAPQLRVQEGITVSGNEVHIPLTETNTQELIDALGNSESATFGCELAGFETGETNPGFLLQFDISIRNRRGDAGTGTPAPVDDQSYTKAQIRALLSAEFAVQLSEDGGTWHDASLDVAIRDTAQWYRFCNSRLVGNWSPPIPMMRGPAGPTPTLKVGTVTTGEPGSAAGVANGGTETAAVFDFTIPRGDKGETGTVEAGTVTMVDSDRPASVTNSGTTTAAVFDFTIPRGCKGEDGRNAYLYVAYATDSQGRGFSLAPATTRRYRAEIQTDEPIDNPSAAAFAGATWVKYIGDDSTVYGDVLVADADTSVEKVSRIVFENATIRRGMDGEAIVRFKEAGVTVDEMNRYATINGRTRLSAWTNGGGSQSAMPGLQAVTPQTLGLLDEFPAYSSFMG